ncbi:hypothetical protein GOV06_04380 [Candidatus Woesearchaeota archaeon]|nr:hypothetical protein [Candidatus Woesearchaeota archaeon]
MKVTHKLNNTSITKNTQQDVNFLLTNKIGGYCLLGDSPASRYQGVFLMDNSSMYKIIENINLLNAPPIKEIVNEFSSVTRKRGAIAETFFMPYGYDALVYELTKPGEIEITLDIRSSYEDPEFGRIYKITKSKSGIIINYKHEKTNFFVVIKPDRLDYKIIKEWEKRIYEYDKNRNSYPIEKYVFKALRLKAQKVIFVFFKSKKQAMEEAEYVFKNLDRLKEHQKIYVSKINTKRHPDPEIRIAKKSAINSLNKLLINLKDRRGIFAGLPWFFQFWTRDELISLKALLLNKQDREVREILLKNLKELKKGLLLNITMPCPDKEHLKELKKAYKRIENIVGITAVNADGIGWLFKRIDDSLSLFSAKEKAEISKKLQTAIDFTSNHLIKDGLLYNGPKKTWMDSEWGGDNREGFRIEIQTLFLNMLKLAYKLTKNKKYYKQEIEMRKTVKEKFWNTRFLADGLDDFTIRPNIFIAAYVYPELLSKAEWTLCFNNILPSLWLNWGGLSSIDKKHPLFCNDSTGEIRKSYHRGDSWFWINNLAALVMKRVNKAKFKKHIDKIIQASTTEILTSGAIGHHAEISSASSLQSQGCIAQAWSNAMFVELIEES